MSRVRKTELSGSLENFPSANTAPQTNVSRKVTIDLTIQFTVRISGTLRPINPISPGRRRPRTITETRAYHGGQAAHRLGRSLDAPGRSPTRPGPEVLGDQT